MKVWVRVALVGLMAAATADSGSALQSRRAAPDGYIGGTVRSSQGPEAGVWVIAETKDLPTNFIKIVVTDDQGRFMVPELPVCDLQRLGSRIRPCRFDADSIEAGHECHHADRDAGQNAAGSGEGISGQLLAVAARAAGSKRVSRHRARRATAWANMLSQNH